MKNEKTLAEHRTPVHALQILNAKAQRSARQGVQTLHEIKKGIRIKPKPTAKI
jgi:hypothetical protein